MEVASIFSSKKELIDLFTEFIYSYHKLRLSSETDDTAYFTGLEKVNQLEIYYHHKLNNLIHEFEYNYTEADVHYIKNYFNTGKIFLFDISYKRKEVFKTLLSDFKAYIKTQKEVESTDIIISDPFSGIEIL